MFAAVQRWINWNPYTKDISAVLSLVPLHFMTMDQLLNIVQPSGLVHNDMILDLIRKITNDMLVSSLSECLILYYTL